MGYDPKMKKGRPAKYGTYSVELPSADIRELLFESGKAYCGYIDHHGERVMGLSEFYKSKNSRPFTLCKSCRNAHKRFLRTGWRISEYQKALKEQGGLCYICKSPNVTGFSLHADHSHSTGKRRALLCFRCNSVLGHCNEDVGLLKAMIDFLQSFGGDLMTGHNEGQAIDPTGSEKDSK